MAHTLSKLSASVPGILGLVGENGATLPINEAPHGFEGRTQQVQSVRNKLKKTEGPRQYAPRLSKPHV
jgi:hypothetical protein